MARADLLVSLVRAATEGNPKLFQETLETVITEERQKQHHILAERLSRFLSANGSGPEMAEQQWDDFDDSSVRGLLYNVTPRRKLEELVLPAIVESACRELIEEHHRRDLLRSHGIESRNRILLAGPPGNGKTTLAEALAEALMVPLFVLRYEGVIGSYLGETASRLQRVFDFVRTRECALFLDEFDTLGKERGDQYETGEIKRVVSSLLLQIDDLPSHVVVITATNHPELLDRAVWRRFQLRLHLPPPDREAVMKWFAQVQERFDLSLGVELDELAEELEGVSFAELEEFTRDVRRRLALADPSEDIATIVNERLAQWGARFDEPNSDYQY